MRRSPEARVVVALVAVGLVVAGCADDADEAARAADPVVCDQLFELEVELEGASDEEFADAVLEVLGDEVPAEITGPVSVLDDSTSTRDERDEALDEIGRFFVVACGGPNEDGEVRLVPSQVPEGLVLCYALDLPEFDLPPDETGTAIWGDASLDDPWAGPLVGLWTTTEDEIPVHDDAVEVMVHGVNGYVAPMSLFQAVSSAEWGHIVTWRDPSGPIIEVAARGASPEEAVRLAELVTLTDVKPSLSGDALGPETVPIHEGRGVLPAGPALSGWSLQYGPETRSDTLEDEDLRLLTITGSAGAPEDVQALRFWAAATEAVEIRGADGLAYAAFGSEGGPFGIAWAEGGRIVQVVGLGLDERVVREITDSLREVDADEWRATKEDVVDQPCLDPSLVPERSRTLT